MTKEKPLTLNLSKGKNITSPLEKGRLRGILTSAHPELVEGFSCSLSLEGEGRGVGEIENKNPLP
jgi:hypothetical protein